MFRWTPYVFIRFTLFLCAGILLYWWQSGLGVAAVSAVFGVAVFGYVGLWRWTQRHKTGFRPQVWFGALAFLVTASFGWLLTHSATGTNQPTHLTQQPKVSFYTGKVVSEVQVRAKNYRFVLEVDRISAERQWRAATGRVLLYTAREAERPAYGDRLIIFGTPQPIKPPANPGEFDYRQYLSLQQIHFQQFVKPRRFLVYEHGTGNPVLAASLRVRAWADSVFRRHIKRPHEQAIVSGLVLGIRDGLDNELKNAYASAGAMHVLAVSGAHVIIVFQIIVLLLGRLKKLRHGHWLFAVSALLILWFYAFVTGLSASVLRAVIMFSFVVVGEAARREGNLFNTLGLSAFLLLCYDPYLLQDVGFQLSYLAVAGIVYLHPRLYRWFDFKHRLPDKLWEMTCVSLAAQIAVFPLTLFYFHQFPTYFLLANLLVIPVSTVVLYGGLLLMAVAWVPYVSSAVAFLLEWTTWLLNRIAFLTEKTPGALVQGIHLNVWELAALYALLVCLLLFFHWPRLRVWTVATTLVLGLSASQLYAGTRHFSQRMLAVYAIPGHATLDLLDGRQHVFLADSALLGNQNRILFHLRNHWGERRVLNVQKTHFSQAAQAGLAAHHTPAFTLLHWHGKRIGILHHPTDARLFAAQRLDLLIVQQNGLKNAKHLPAGCAAQVVLDATNRYYRAKRLQAAFTERGFRCHNVLEDGAFVWEMNK
jgi:competence protein ComEC